MLDPEAAEEITPDVYSDPGALIDAGPGEGEVNIPLVNADDNTIESVLNYVFALIGALSVLMLIIGGVRYIVSAGDPQKISSSKNTIIYAIIGLVIAVSSALIVNFIFNVIESNPAGNSGAILW